MKTKLCDVVTRHDPEDKSGVGVRYVDAFIKPMNVKLEDGRQFRCKRRGLKLTLTAGDRKGEALLRRLDHGPDHTSILHAALQEAARNAGVELGVEGEAVYVQ
jgi:hypothetical protein